MDWVEVFFIVVTICVLTGIASLFLCLPFKIRRDKRRHKQDIQRRRARVTENPQGPVQGAFRPRRKWPRAGKAFDKSYYGRDQ